MMDDELAKVEVTYGNMRFENLEDIDDADAGNCLRALASIFRESCFDDDELPEDWPGRVNLKLVLEEA